MSERRELFVAYMGRGTLNEFVPDGDYTATIYPKESQPALPCGVPVVVTPLLPDDPRPGETWEVYGAPHLILSAPYSADSFREVVTRGEYQICRTRISDLRRPPVLKTFRLKGGAFIDDGDLNVRAESKHAALAKLKDALEEVP